MALDVETLKQQTNVTGTADDAVLLRMLNAAKSHTVRLLGYALDDAEQTGGDVADLEQAVLLLAAHWYENREATLVGVTASSLPFGYEDIIRERRLYTFAVSDDG